MKYQLCLLSCVAAALCCSLGQANAAEPKPVESDMHEFMEYVYQPTYKRLKPAMAAEPKENAVWKEIKSTSLILAESGNLLLSRAPEEGAAEWNEYSIATRELGGDLYRAAKKKDYAAATTAYKAMLQKCNACHTKFAHGEHQLAP
ncbi:hypothetical protein LOC68_12955 [Blastopirellula sp. JC732]|uniref:Cytochrome c n=1 Tax=Blastopirellula sediminis TaxID=2894196 RepID=A0A9X1SH15_9BACT|nr:hypothetical protein [Blastopirellula sediminis]MCC9607401.1 hypothetical protein [Blastopirellula sediminis]MCC9629306.1 hypothetical protein [Blastopirellula sediminis]